jgi:hypothetical protein
MSKEIRTFLSSPRSLEPAEVRKKRRRRVARCSMPRSIFMEQDMSKLTARQRILFQKYWERRESVNPLFLVMNNLPADHLRKRVPEKKDEKSSCVIDNERAEEVQEQGFDDERRTEAGDIREQASAGQEPPNAPADTDFVVEDHEIETDSISHEEAETESGIFSSTAAFLRSDDGTNFPEAEQDIASDSALDSSAFEEHSICRECVSDAAEMFNYLMRSTHRCRLSSKIAAYKSRIRQNFRNRLCFSTIKKSIAEFVRELETSVCCRPEAGRTS